MLKVRSKIIYDAVQWFPGVAMKNVHGNRYDDGEKFCTVDPCDWFIINSDGEVSNIVPYDKIDEYYETITEGNVKEDKVKSLHGDCQC